MEELKRIWERVQAELADEVSAVSFDSWIKPIEASDYPQSTFFG